MGPDDMDQQERPGGRRPSQAMAAQTCALAESRPAVQAPAVPVLGAGAWPPRAGRWDPGGQSGLAGLGNSG